LKRCIFSHRSQDPAFFDMSCRFRPGRAHWYGQGFRLGDRAAAYVYMFSWRRNNPKRRLVVTEDSTLPGTGWSKFLPAKWMFHGLADEIWIVANNETIPRPTGTALYNRSVWSVWAGLRKVKKLRPNIQPMGDAVTRMRRLRERIGLPGRYVTVAPLFDAAYNTYRNAPVPWWRQLCEGLAYHGLNVLVLQHPKSQFVPPAGCWSTKAYGINAMDSLALINQACLHLGGETGLTLWAGILKTPLVALYRNWSLSGKLDFRPISFGAPVLYYSLDGTGEEASLIANGLFSKLR